MVTSAPGTESVAKLLLAVANIGVEVSQQEVENWLPLSAAPETNIGVEVSQQQVENWLPWSAASKLTMLMAGP